MAAAMTKELQKPKKTSVPPARPEASHLVRVDPPELVKEVLLGGTQRVRYSVDDLKSGSHVKWHHEVSGAGGARVFDHTGAGSELKETATHAGDREIDTTAVVDGLSESAPTTTLRTPQGVTNILRLWAESKQRGRVPTSHAIQDNEKLVAEVELPSVADSVSQIDAGFTGQGLSVESWRKTGAKKFEVVLATSVSPRGPKDASHDATGSLLVVPRGVSSSAITPAALPMRIDAGSENPHVYGSRPNDTGAAVRRAVRSCEQLYKSRTTAIADLMNEIAVTDPLPEDPLWKQFLIGAASVALGAVTAGVGAGLVREITGESFGIAAKQELIKVFMESGSSAVIEKGVSEAMKDAEGAPGGAHQTAGGTFMSPEVFFQHTQRNALKHTQTDHVNQLDATLSSLTSALDRDTPGAGFRAAMEAATAIEQQSKLASDLQFASSLQAWCTFIAQARLGVGNPNLQRHGGTELGSQINIHKIIPKGEVPAPNLDQTAGVLRLELAQLAPGHVIVVRSFIAGFKGDTVVNNLSKKVRDLNIPIVARFNERDGMGDRTRRGFVISRNELGVVLAESKGSVMQDMFGGKSDHDAAKTIFDEQIAHQTLEPKRG